MLDGRGGKTVCVTSREVVSWGDNCDKCFDAADCTYRSKNPNNITLLLLFSCSSFSSCTNRAGQTISPTFYTHLSTKTSLEWRSWQACEKGDTRKKTNCVKPYVNTLDSNGLQGKMSESCEREKKQQANNQRGESMIWNHVKTRHVKHEQVETRNPARSFNHVRNQKWNHTRDVWSTGVNIKEPCGEKSTTGVKNLKCLKK